MIKSNIYIFEQIIRNNCVSSVVDLKYEIEHTAHRQAYRFPIVGGDRFVCYGFRTPGSTAGLPTHAI